MRSTVVPGVDGDIAAVGEADWRRFAAEFFITRFLSGWLPRPARSFPLLSLERAGNSVATLETPAWSRVQDKDGDGGCGLELNPRNSLCCPRVRIGGVVSDDRGRYACFSECRHVPPPFNFVVWAPCCACCFEFTHV